MTTRRVIRYTYDDPSDPNTGQGYVQTSQSGTGETWTIRSGNIGRVGLSNSNTTSKTLRFAFERDFRIPSPVYDIPASRCIVRYKARQQLSLNTISGGIGVTYQITYSSSPHGTTTYNYFSPTQYNLYDFMQTGSDVQTTTANLNQITYANCYVDIRIVTANTNSNRLHAVTLDAIADLLANTLPAGSLLYQWEAINHEIDGLNGDTPPVITTECSLTASASVIKFAGSNIETECSLSENSVSVITGVQKTLENNFSLSAAVGVKYSVSRTIRQETELLGTTFNFRFADPLTIFSNYTSSLSGNIIRNVGSSLTLSADVNANFTGNMIYDIATDYIWDDFSIVGYFITGYTLRGYAADSAEYTWADLASDPWDSYTYSSWQGPETGWDQWPEDIWNSTKRISFDFDVTEVGNIIRSGVGQLLSRTSLSDNSAFRIEGTPDTIRSDFLCDGSPAGLIGGFSTITQDSILTGLGNYIINNAQNIEGAFDATLLANYIAKFLWSVRSDFNLDITPTFKPSGVTNAQCIAVVDALANYKINNPQNIDSAFDPIFTARIFFTTDPYQIYRVLQETRQIFVDAESRGIEIAEEIRLNSIPAENRDWLVPQETRNMKLRIPPMTNRFTTPKIRRE